MHTPLVIYLATLAGAVGLLLMMPKRHFNLRPIRVVGGVIGAAAVGALWLFLASRLPDSLGGMRWDAFAYYYVFSALAIIAAVRVITHTRPVYSALWFVMVVLASTGLLLVLSAEFMAFAIVIIYAGAILVTYMFVIMLATQSSPDNGDNADNADVSADYDRVAREPVGAIVAGFLLLAVLLNVATNPGVERNVDAAMESDEVLAATVLAARPGDQLEQQLTAQLDTSMPAQRDYAVGLEAASGISNTERVGLDLFRAHPLGLELAGIILLVALIGAVVIAKTRVEEEEKPTPPVPDETGATARPHTEPGPHATEARGISGGRVGT